MAEPNIGYEIKYVYIDGKMTMYRLYYWKKQHMDIKVDHNAQIFVYARKKDDIKSIEKFVLSNRYTIQYWQRHREDVLINIPGNSITILNKKHTIKYVNKRIKSGFEILGTTIYVDSKKKWKKYELEEAIFDKTACQYMIKSTNIWAKRMGIKNKKVTFTWTRSRWGLCCPSMSYIDYSYLLCPFEKKAIDSVVVHELCHYFYLNHHKEFWLEVGKWFPDYGEYDKVLNSTYWHGTVENHTEMM